MCTIWITKSCIFSRQTNNILKYRMILYIPHKAEKFQVLYKIYHINVYLRGKQGGSYVDIKAMASSTLQRYIEIAALRRTWRIERRVDSCIPKGRKEWETRLLSRLRQRGRILPAERRCSNGGFHAAGRYFLFMRTVNVPKSRS